MNPRPAPPSPPDDDTPYYVIIGCGFSAILNHTLLLQSPTRWQGQPILHIGKPDPWGSYHPMQMGQWPTLLTLPGFPKRPSKLGRSTNLRSDEFAKVNRFAWNRLAGLPHFVYKNGLVEIIRKSTKRDEGYEVVCDDGKIYQADFIDVCGGPGPARSPSRSLVGDPTLCAEYNGTAGPKGWPRVVSGEDFLTAKRKAVPLGGEICVYGGGPTGAWCVEHAQSLGHLVYWIAKDELRTAFVASRRNDVLLRNYDHVIRENVGGDQVVTGRLRPRRARTVFGENLRATTITPNEGGGVEISFAPATPTAWRLTGSRGPIAPSRVLTLSVDQVVLSIGQETFYDETRSWAYLLSGLLEEAIHEGKDRIFDDQRRLVGLRSLDERIRLLGASALSHPRVAAEWKRPRSPSNIFFRSLVEQARVPNGITLSAITVAEANEFWSMAPNNNLNTCGMRDLNRLTLSWPEELLGAETWFVTRGHRIPPFTTNEFRNLARGKISY